MIYEENKKRKFPHRYRFENVIVHEPYQIPQFHDFVDRLCKVIPRKNFTYRINPAFDLETSNLVTSNLDLFFKNQEDSFIFKLTFSDDDYIKRLNLGFPGAFDAAAFYCPYIPLQTVSSGSFSISNFMTRYDA